jgi:GAF domain-containing protein
MNSNDSSNINKRKIEPAVESTRVTSSQEVLLQNLLNGTLILSTILLFLNLFNSIQKNEYVSAAFIVAAYGIIFLITFARMVPYTLRVDFLAVVYFILGVFSFIQSGINANGLLYFAVSSLVLALLGRKYSWIVSVAFSAVAVSILSYLIQSGIIEIGSTLVAFNTVLYWISISVNFVFIAILFSAPVSQYMMHMNGELGVVNKRNSDLESENESLVQKRVEFQNNLDKRRLRLVTTRQISREISHQSNVEKLLHDSVELIRTQLSYQYVSLFLSDDRDENAFLKAASGEGSQALLDRNFRIRIHEMGIISNVITRGEAHIANDLSEESGPNRYFIRPNSQSELTLPLRFGQKVIGALDVQSTTKNAFDDEDIDLLQSVADQLATVIDKTSQIQALQNKVTSLEETYRSYTRGTWQSHLESTKSNLSYAYINGALETDFDQPQTAEDALTIGEAVIAPANSDINPDAEDAILSVPILLRDQILGVVNIKYHGPSIPDDLSALVNNASDRLALALENARLLEQIQERAEREHLVGEISTKLRSANDIDSILRTTVSELGKTLGIDEVRIQLKSAESK